MGGGIVKDHIPEQARLGGLQVHGDDVAPAGVEIVDHGRAVGHRRVGQVAAVGVNPQPGVVNVIDIKHALPHGVHKGGFHGLKAHGDALSRGQLYGLLQALQKVFPAVLPLILFVVGIVTGQLDGADAQIVGQINGFFHDLHAPLPDGGILGAEGESAVAGQAHAADGQPGTIHLLHQRQPLFLCPFQPGKLVIGFVNAELHIIEAAVLGAVQLLAQRHGAGHGLFV